MVSPDKALVARGRRYAAIGGLTAAASVGGLLAFRTPIWIAVAAVGVVLGSLFVQAGLMVGRGASAMPIYLRLVALIRDGKLDEADAAIAELSHTGAGSEPVIANVLFVCRASVAYSRGELAKVVEAATSALGTNGPGAGGTWDESLRVEATALRAVSLAALGQAFEADVDAVARSKQASPSALARAEIARAIALARSDDKTKLGEHLSRQAALVLGFAGPFERALFRALRSWAHASGSAYREPPRASAEGRLRAWVHEVLPAAAPFAPPAPAPGVRHPGRPAGRPERSHEVLAQRLLRVKKPKQVRWWAYAILLGTAGGCVFVQRIEDVVGLAFLSLLLLALIAYLRVRLARGERSISEAEREEARGNLPAARQLLRGVADRGTSIGAIAGYHLARLANREGDFLGAQREVEAALRLCKPAAALEVTRFFVLPALLAENALALAGLDRFEEAERELMVLREAFPDYVNVAAASLRVRLVIATRRGDLEAAAAVAAERSPELNLDFPTDVLADLAAGDRSLLADLPRATRTWLEAVAPSLVRSPNASGAQA